MRNTRTGIRQSLLAVAVLSCLCTLACPVTVIAQPAGQAQSWTIAAGPLEAALRQAMTQGKLTISYAPDLIANKTTQGVSGAYPPAEALRRLLRGTGLTVDTLSATTFVVRRAAQDKRQPAAEAPAASSSASDEAPPIEDMQAVTVTGTHIRGGSSPSPAITIGSERIQEEGFADLGEVIRSIPQNFSGGQNPGVISGNLAGAGLANQNVTGGSSLNLRGLGPNASVTLINGRRMPYGGFAQAVDISAIPVEAVDRIEIVTDGASAIYGSDAVGGVGNVLIKRDFDGVALGARYGTATEGGLATREYTATAGTLWDSGGLIATYKDASVDPIYAADRDYTAHLTHPTTIYPGSDVRSGLFGIHHSIGDGIELRLDALRTEREQRYNYVLGGRTTRVTPETTTSVVAPGIEFRLPNDWTLSLAGAWGKDEHLQVQAREDLATGLFPLQIDDCYCNESRAYELSAEGPLFAMGGGDARLAVGAGHRSNEYLHYDRIASAVNTRGRESSRFAYAEVSLPLLGGQQTGQRLVLTAAMRSEAYDSAGTVTTPKLGLVYGPGADFTVKASWGKSFKMPTLYERHYAQRAALYRPDFFGATGYGDDATVLTASGGNPNLGPERARTWTASLAFHPEVLPGLEAELTWFDIDYTDRVVEPITNFAEAMTNPVYADFVNYTPTAGELAEVLAAAEVFSNYAGVPYDPGDVAAILYFQYVNASDQRIKGLDLSGRYMVEAGAGRLTFRGSASWLDSTQQISSTRRPYDLAGTLHNPARVNGRVGMIWDRDGLSASVFSNYRSGVMNTVDGEKTASFTTFDATLRYRTGFGGGAWSGVDIALSAQNLFDRAPPLYTPAASAMAYLAPYDSTNYSPIGRFLSLSVSKHW